MMDTDEEVTCGRVTLLNGNGPPYFHGYLYMKGEVISTLFVSLLLRNRFAENTDKCYRLLLQLA